MTQFGRVVSCCCLHLGRSARPQPSQANLQPGRRLRNGGRAAVPGQVFSPANAWVAVVRWRLPVRAPLTTIMHLLHRALHEHQVALTPAKCCVQPIVFFIQRQKISYLRSSIFKSKISSGRTDFLQNSSQIFFRASREPLFFPSSFFSLSFFRF